MNTLTKSQIFWFFFSALVLLVLCTSLFYVLMKSILTQ